MQSSYSPLKLERRKENGLWRDLGAEKGSQTIKILLALFCATHIGRLHILSECQTCFSQSIHSQNVACEGCRENSTVQTGKCVWSETDMTVRLWVEGNYSTHVTFLLKGKTTCHFHSFVLQVNLEAKPGLLHSLEDKGIPDLDCGQYAHTGLDSSPGLFPLESLHQTIFPRGIILWPANEHSSYMIGSQCPWKLCVVTHFGSSPHSRGTGCSLTS